MRSPRLTAVEAFTRDSLGGDTAVGSAIAVADPVPG